MTNAVRRITPEQVHW